MLNGVAVGVDRVYVGGSAYSTATTGSLTSNAAAGNTDILLAAYDSSNGDAR